MEQAGEVAKDTEQDVDERVGCADAGFDPDWEEKSVWRVDKREDSGWMDRAVELLEGSEDTCRRWEGTEWREDRGRCRWST